MSVRRTDSALPRAASAARILCASLALPLCAACGSEAAPPPPGTAFMMDDLPIAESEIDELMPYLLEWHPEHGEDSVRAEVITAGVLPRAILRHDFPDGLKKAKDDADKTWAMLAEKRPFEEVKKIVSPEPPRPGVPLAPETPLRAARRDLEIYLGRAVMGKPAGHLTGPVETTYGYAIARVDQPVPDAGPQQEGLYFSIIEFTADPAVGSPEIRRNYYIDRMRKAKISIVNPQAARWLPAALQNCIVNRDFLQAKK